MFVTNYIDPTAQDIISAIHGGNSFVVNGDLIDDLRFTASSNGKAATMGQRLHVKPGDTVTITISVRDPEDTNLCPYSFDNPSLAQVGVSQSLKEPVLDHVDLIGGRVTGLIDPGNPEYSNPTNPTAKMLKRFERLNQADYRGYMTYTYEYKAEAGGSMYFRLRGTNLPPGTPHETDAHGNPLLDSEAHNIPCPDCPSHVGDTLDFDVEAWADLWFMSNPVFVMVDSGRESL